MQKSLILSIFFVNRKSCDLKTTDFKIAPILLMEISKNCFFLNLNVLDSGDSDSGSELFQVPGSSGSNFCQEFRFRGTLFRT